MAILTGTGPNQLVTAADLGTLGFQNHNEVEIDNGRAALDEYQKAYSAPKIKPTLNLPFARMTNFDPRVSFSRASDAYEYKGDSQKAEENQRLYSEQFDNAYWVKSGITILSNQTLAPNGTNTADLTSQNTGVTTAGSISRGFSGSGLFVSSVYAKANTKNWILLGVTGNTGVYFDLLNGVVGTTNNASVISSSITPAANGFYRVSIVVDILTPTTLTFPFYAVDTDNSTTVVDSGGIFVWGAQLEQRDTLTDYQRTTDRIIQKYVDTYSLVTSNKPRFKEIDPVSKERKGLLVEEARTNLFLYSNDFTNAYWTKLDVLLSSGVPSPLGSSSLIYGANTNTSKQLYPSTLSITNGTTYTTSVYVKYAGTRYVQITGSNGFDAVTFSNFDTITGEVVGGNNIAANVSVDKLDNGWFRLNYTQVATLTSNSGRVIISLVGSPNATRIQSYQGDGYSGIYISQAQLEVGSFATSPILTTTAQVTRALDNTRITGQNFQDIYRLPKEWSLYAHLTDYLSTANLNTNLVILRNASALAGIAITNPTTVAAGGLSRTFFDGQTKVATAFTSGEPRVTGIDGIGLEGGTSQNNIDFDEIYIGTVAGSVNQLNGTISHVAYYPQALSADELAFLTRNTSDE